MSNTSGRFEVRTTREARGARTWPLDIALFTIAMLLLAIILRFLDFSDPRPLYNAWTYIVGIPASMIVLSMILKLFVGRFVERTLQISFLISTAIHLLLLIGALNLVIFARYWPDVYQSVTFEAAPQKVVVPEYFKPANTGSVKQKPEYLKPVDTKSESAVRDVNKARRENLADLPQTDIPTEEPTKEKSELSFEIPNPKPSPTQPTIETSEATNRKREDLNTPAAPSMRSIDLPDLDPKQANPPELKPAEMAAKKSSSSVPSALRPIELPQDLSEAMPRVAEMAKLPRAIKGVESPEVQSSSTSIKRNQTQPKMELPQNKIEVAESSSSAAPTAAKLPEARELPSKQSPSRSSTSSASANLAANLPDEPSVQSTSQPLPDMVRSRQGNIAIDALPGDIANAPKRETAGGISSESSQQSPLMTAPIAISSRATAETGASASEAIPESRVDQRSGVRRDVTPSSLSSASSDLIDPSNDSDRSYSGASTLPQGIVASKGVTEGPAIRDDNGGMIGSTGPLVRSRLSEPGGTLNGEGDGPSVTATKNDKAIPLPGDGSRPVEGAPSSAESRSVDVGRPGNGKASDSKEGTLNSSINGDPLDTNAGEGLTKGDSAAKAGKRGEAELMNELAGAGQFQANEPLQRGRKDSTSSVGAEVGSLDGPLLDKSIPIPSTGNGEGNGDMDALFGPEPSNRAAEDGSKRQSADGNGLESSLNFGDGHSEAAAMLLDAPRDGLDRRGVDLSQADVEPMDIQTQRFRRKDLGGPTVEGSGAPIPAPAFKRRLDRNRDMSDKQNLGPLGPETEETIERGLAFLAAHQRPDGSWHLEDFDSKVEIRSDTAATALALLAFQGAGYTHRQDKYATNLTKALEFLLRNQRDSGDLYMRMDKTSDTNGWLYSHSIASLALCEAYGMTQDPKLQEPAQRAVDFMIASQDLQGGGWRYTPGFGSDTSVTGWFMMALKSAQLSGLEVKPDVFEGIKKWVTNSQASTVEPHLYRYNWKAPDTPTQRHGRDPTPTMTSVGLLMRLYLGWKRDDKPMQDGAEYLLHYPPAIGTEKVPRRDTYYWYYTTQFMFHMGGDTWKEWNGQLQPMLVKSQMRDGQYAGSWDPLGEVPDAWGKFGGRLYVTTLNLLSLEVYYRHLPLYEATAN